MDGNSLVVDDGAQNQYCGSKIMPVTSSPEKCRDDTFILLSGNLLQWKNDEEQKVQVINKDITMGERLGLKDLVSIEVWRASIGELLGTAALVFMIDTIIISSYTDLGAPRLIMATLIAITVALIVLATIPVSGGYINPIVSMSAGLLGLISLSRAFIYILAQCTGGVLGALALKAVLDSNIQRTFSLGGCTVTVVTPGPDGPITTGINKERAFFLEVVCSFIFLFSSRWIAFDPRQAKQVGRVIVYLGIGVAAGLNVFVSTTITGVKGYSGAGINPARCLGPAIVRGGHLWDGHWIYWVGPLTASVGFYWYTRIIPDEHFGPNKRENDLLNILKASIRMITTHRQGRSQDLG